MMTTLARAIEALGEGTVLLLGFVALEFVVEEELTEVMVDRE